MSATDATATAPTAPVEEVKPAETTPAPVTEVEVAAAVATEAQQEVKTEEIPAPAETTTAKGEVAPAATEEPAKEETKPAEGGSKKEGNFLINILNSLKPKKAKAAKSPTDEKKKEEVEMPTVEEAPKEEATASEPVAEASKVEEAPPADPVKETETATPATESKPTPATEEKKAEKLGHKVSRAGKRLSSSLVGLLGPKPKPEVTAPAKVDENPPMIEEPVPVAPLDNPASESTPATEPKPGDAATETTAVATAASPVVTAAA